MMAWPIARKLLLIFTWVGMIVAGFLLLGGIGADGWKRYILAGAAVVLFLLLFEQRWVLKRPDVRRYFDPYGYIA
jgi:hypothetical protein